MRERVKRIVAQILTFVMLMSMMPMDALAQGLNSYISDMVSALSGGASVLSLQVNTDNNTATMLVGDKGTLVENLSKKYKNVN